MRITTDMTKNKGFIAGCWEATSSNEVREKLELLLRSAAAVWPELECYEITTKKNARPSSKVDYEDIKASLVKVSGG